MATHKSDKVLKGMVPIMYSAGMPFTVVATFTSAAEIAINDEIQMAEVMNGFKIVDIRLMWEAIGTGALFDIGDGEDVDRFFDGLDVAAAGKADLIGSGVSMSLGYEYSGIGTNLKDTIDIKVLGAVIPVDKTIKMVVSYVLEDGVIE